MSTSINNEQVDDALYREMLVAMEANLGEQERPKVGIFWYSPQIKDVFGVLARDGEDQARITERNAVSCKELHENIWRKKKNYYNNHGGNPLYAGDYMDTPRGRVFYLPTNKEFVIVVGSWINENPEAVERIKEAFDLTDELIVTVKIGFHDEYFSNMYNFYGQKL